MYGHWCEKKKMVSLLLPKLMSKLIDLHRQIILCFFKQGLLDHPMNIALISLFRNYFPPFIKTSTVTSQNKEENNGNLNVSIHFLVVGWTLSCVKLMVQGKRRKVPLGKRWKLCLMWRVVYFFF